MPPDVDDGPVLPRSSRRLIDGVPCARRHAGLQLDKLSSAGEMKDQREALAAVTQCVGDDALLRALAARRRAALDAVGACRFTMETRGPLTLHLSRSGSMENAGIALHPVYGFVYLPGSGIKGLARAWAETVWAPAQADKAEAWQRIERVFGWSPESEGHKRAWRPDEIEEPSGSAVGRVVFHDAWPCRWPSIGVDVVNNHHRDYYAGKDDPGDWETPVLVYFLAAGRGVPFEFSLSDRTRADDGLLESAREWLSAALQFEGAGAKTAAGYGRFAAADAQSGTAPPKPLESARYDLRLASPGFLAGADQGREDCDLRPATLRGLLRWWWRTLHTAHVDRETLRHLETTVWGDAQAGSPVRLALERTDGASPEPHPGKHDRAFLQRHGISRPDSKRKVTQGLFYASYGMAEGGSKRWFLPAGSSWGLTLTARDGRLAAGNRGAADVVPAALLLEQASIAVWLLARFGGAGSRSRKGFGSFDDVEVRGVASVDDCRAAAARFRDACGLRSGACRSLESPALDDVIVVEQRTQWGGYPWFAIDRIGTVLQSFAKDRGGEERIPLGLPRRTGRGRDARPLRAGRNRIERHASPAIWSLAAGDDGTLTVRLAAFPSPRLPNRKTSEETLRELATFARQELAREAKRQPSAGSRNRSAPAAPRGGAPRNDTARPALEKGTIVQAVLLETKTKKGGWRARHEETGKEMPIQNTQAVPGECKPGDKVELLVFASDAFKWLTDEVRHAHERGRRAPAQRRGPPTGRRGR